MIRAYFFLLVMLLPSIGWATCYAPSEVSIPYPPLTINGGNPIGMHSPDINAALTWTSSQYSENFIWDTCEGTAADGTSVLRPVGTTVPGVTVSDEFGTYGIFEIPSVEGVGYRMRVRTRNTGWQAVGPDAETVIRTLGPVQGSTQIVLSISLYAYGSPPPGNYAVPLMHLADWGLRTASGAFYQPTGWVPVNIQPTSLIINTLACELISPSEVIAELPRVGTTEFSGVGSTAPGSASFQFSLSCPPEVALNVTLSDAVSPGNTSDTLTLAPGATAKGIGVQIFREGQAMPVNFGPDSPMAGTLNQWLVGSGASSYTLPFLARYIQTESPVTPGTVNALATITFSYQ